jgi:hypothetical protein
VNRFQCISFIKSVESAFENPRHQRSKDNNENNIKQSKRQFPFRIENERGHLVNVDSRPEYGGNDMGASPMELVLMGVAGCSAIDMISF